MLTTEDPAVDYGTNPTLNEQQIDRIINLALETFGPEEQTQMLFEEMAELQNAICKYARGRDTREHICEEIADVLIMLLQMAAIYGVKSVEQWANKKALRLARRLTTLTGKPLTEILTPIQP